MTDNNQRVNEQACKTCAGTGIIDDGEIDCWPNGMPHENGPVKCVTDCPSCKGTGRAAIEQRASKITRRLTRIYAAALRTQSKE